MKILVDENIPAMTVRSLREAGHDVADFRGTLDQGVDDDVLWARAQQEVRLLITTDRGFADRRAEPHHGILIVRLRQPNRQKIHERIIQAMAQLGEPEWPGTLITMRDSIQSVWRAEPGSH